MLKKVIFILTISIFCFSTIACKSKAEREFDAAMDEYNDAMDDLQREIDSWDY